MKYDRSKLEKALDIPFESDIGWGTVRSYLKTLLTRLWEEEELFSGKRPFGNSGWKYDLIDPLSHVGVIKATFDRDGYVEECDDKELDKVVLKLIDIIFEA